MERLSGYKSGLEKLRKTIVVKDVAERHVKLIQEYNNILTKDETKKQFALQIVNENRKTYPSATKYSQEKIIFLFQDSQFLRLFKISYKLLLQIKMSISCRSFTFS